jgi:biotin carboxylase
MAENFSGKRLLIAGAGIFQIPAIQKARDMGIKVITVDKNPKSPGYEVVSTGDTPGLLKVARKYKIDGIMTLSTEVAVVPVAYVAEKLGLPGLTVETARKATNKYLMRTTLKKHNVPCPDFYPADSLKDLKKAENLLQYPLMVKPSEGYASKGIVKVKNSKELKNAFYKARDISSGKPVIVEEFIRGPEVGGESFTVDSLTKMIYITNKKVTRGSLYIPLGHSLPSILQLKVQNKIKNVIKKGILALGVNNGPVNFDVIVSEKGPLLIEMGARLGGNCLPVIVTLHSGIDTVRESITLALGGKLLIREKFRKPVGVRILTSNVTGTISKISGMKELQNNTHVKELNFMYTIGDRVHKFSSGVDKTGYIIGVGKNIKEVEKTLDSYTRKIKITVSEKTVSPERYR